MFHFPEQYRAQFKNTPRTNAGKNGGFIIPSPVSDRRHLLAIAATGLQWEHVSVHTFIGKGNLTPYWEEMNFVKNLFWDKEDIVMQLHPRESEYINNHKHVLHLWRPVGVEIPTPPMILV
ncbi:MAG TPA: hypothetical protein DIW23_04810 [Anaerolineae bacterium]|nr:hypothetical protein [Anaerolineae bacterium]HRJ75749.1 hypothetical protein [Anaerolineales bacterium]